MSETSPTPNAKKPNYMLRRVVVGGLAGAGVVGAVLAGKALTDKPDEGKVEQPTYIQAPDNGTAWDLAREIKSDDVSQRELSNEIAKQADEQGYPGVEQGEVYELPADHVSKDAQEKLGIEFIGKNPEDAPKIPGTE